MMAQATDSTQTPPGTSNERDARLVTETRDPLSPAPIDFHSPQLTLRSALTGMLLGGVLSICNVYTGLKIGWGLNMSITGVLVAFAFWYAIHTLSRRRISMMGKLENNVSQAAVSAGAAVSSAGLVSAIPAVTMLDGITLPWWQLALWLISVCAVGISVAAGLRQQMIIRDKLPFPSGIACAATITEIYNTGAEAIAKVRALILAAIVGSLVKIWEITGTAANAAVRTYESALKAGQDPLPPEPTGFFSSLVRAGWYPHKTDLGVKIHGSPASAYSFALEPTLLLYAVGGLIGLRAGLSILLGAVVSYGFIAGWLVESKTVSGTGRPVTEWLLWPGVTLMVVSSLVAFMFSAPAIFRAMGFTTAASSQPAEDQGDVPRKWFIWSMAAALLLSVTLQSWLFAIPWWAGTVAVLLSFFLAIVAGRVSGETNVTPVGPMGKITQLTFAGLMPQSATANLMAAGVTSGAASQCGDLMHDLKTGYLLGAVARYQVAAQFLGAVAGCLVGSAFYLLLIPDPVNMLATEAWPAPAVVQWKSVALVFREGISALPMYATTAMLIAAIVGVIIPVAEKLSPEKVRTWIPSASAFGLAFVIPASNSVSFFLGALVIYYVGLIFKTFSSRFLVTILAGIIAGETLTGAGDAIRLVFAAE
jgi:uncharacterized oligopeptide transporter (OPT) family protein